MKILALGLLAVGAMCSYSPFYVAERPCDSDSDVQGRGLRLGNQGRGHAYGRRDDDSVNVGQGRGHAYGRRDDDSIGNERGLRKNKTHKVPGHPIGCGCGVCPY